MRQRAAANHLLSRSDTERSHMPILNFKRRLSNETGFILPTAVVMLLILTVLIGAAITVAAQTSTSTTRDDNTKAALEAAEAGLQVAAYRLTKIEPGSKECISGSQKKASEGECKSEAESLGNGATFQYWTSLPLEVGKECAGRKVEKIETGATLHCVTSEGKVNGVTPGTRLRTLVEAKAGESLFSVKGILGLEEVLVSGSVKVPGVVASNKLITSGGKGSGAFEKGYEICPGGEFKPKPKPSTEREASGVTVGGKKEDPELEKTRSASECPIKAQLPKEEEVPIHATVKNNEDSRIGVQDEFFTEGKATNYFTGEPKYELKLSSKSKLTLAGSKYYLCNFIAEHAGELIIAAGAHVEIFIDSPEDKASKCPAGTGKFETGEFQLNNISKAPGSLLIEMYGKGPFTISSGATFEGSIYAPEAEVLLNGGMTFKGAIVGNKVHLENGAGIFEWNSGPNQWPNGKATPYGPKSWEQCTPGSGASEGC
jgi:Tfp pilus assembly protein PilX